MRAPECGRPWKGPEYNGMRQVIRWLHPLQQPSAQARLPPVLRRLCPVWKPDAFSDSVVALLVSSLANKLPMQSPVGLFQWPAESPGHRLVRCQREGACCLPHIQFLIHTGLCSIYTHTQSLRNRERPVRTWDANFTLPQEKK